jgi:aconitate hydratase
LTVRAATPGGTSHSFQVVSRIDTPEELSYFRHGGILHNVLRQLVRQ